MDREEQARTKPERFQAWVALEKKWPKEASGDALCGKNAGTGIGGDAKGQRSTFEQRDNCPTLTYQ
jgi:hypothetical protein